MAERNPTKSPAAVSKAAQAGPRRKHPSPAANELPEYRQVVANTVRLIQDSRRRALATVNYELVCLYWRIGQIIVQQQERARWGDGVVERFAKDLRLAFPDMKGLSRDNVFRMKQFFESCREIDCWLQDTSSRSIVGTVSRQLKKTAAHAKARLPFGRGNQINSG